MLLGEALASEKKYKIFVLHPSKEQTTLTYGVQLPEFSLHFMAPSLGQLVMDPLLTLGEWNWPLLHQLISPDVVPFIMNIHCPSSTIGTDFCYWEYGNHGQFSIKYAYHKLSDSAWDKCNTKWSLIWKLPVQEIIKYFLCLSSRNLLFTSLETAKKLKFFGCLSFSNIITTVSSHSQLMTEFFQTFSSQFAFFYYTKEVRWNPAPTRWVTLNTDGSVSVPSSIASRGGLIRDCQGNWLWLQCQTDCGKAFKLVTSPIAHLSPLALVRAISQFTSKVFTWHGATIEIDGDTETDYTADETPMNSYVNLHAVLEVRRNRAKASFPDDSEASQVFLSTKSDYCGASRFWEEQLIEDAS
ncbi:hypothetical protein F3Y22_tig00017725pilonHSYRG00028 [Hibiscus syriacus]|uniref:Clp1 N-terminal domain-containing protein n=1 Tax=Hibiscus syriacus TaxID=106335 RepID=A0A6A3BYL3_HIBSY|nr:hypothetical protein F3Y22_tig00017725pilonHSYRG00028 [Hibiscus syriacus]